MRNWDGLKQTCMNCTRCGLCETRHNLVFGIGNVKADILFVGEGPGEQEDLKGEPFVGPAGKLLDDMLSIIDLDRHENCYIANIVKCRPPRNRDPLETEQEACIDYLRNQVALIKPKVIVCLGRIAAQKLIDPVVRLSRIDPRKKSNAITREERAALRDALKKFPLTPVSFRPIDEAIITSGGVEVSGLHTKTMMSKTVPGLFFAGEVIDVDAYTGGYNLQIAFSTGVAAGQSASQFVLAKDDIST